MLPHELQAHVFDGWLCGRRRTSGITCIPGTLNRGADVSIVLHGGFPMGVDGQPSVQGCEAETSRNRTQTQQKVSVDPDHRAAIVPKAELANPNTQAVVS